MGDWNTGSVTDELYKLVDSIPSTISGTSVTNIVNQRLVKINNFLGTSYTNTTIVDAIQGPITMLSQAKLLLAIETQGSDAVETRLGEFSIKKGQGSSALSSAKALEMNAMDDLTELKGKAGVFKANG